MPFVQITLTKGKPPKTISTIVDSVHKALVEEFKIPELDKFQIVQEVEANNLIFPPNYLGVPHSENIVYIHITAKKGRTVEMKKQLYKKIAMLISEKTSISSDDVFIVLSENKEENWSFGRGQAQLVE